MYDIWVKAMYKTHTPGIEWWELMPALSWEALEPICQGGLFQISYLYSDILIFLTNLGRIQMKTM